jgi:ABC-type transport system involved in multi-copper enzyme maturation permease subunit
VNGNLVFAFWRQRLMSPLRLVFMLMMFAVPLLTVLAAPGMGLTPMRDVRGFTLVLALGMIGQDVSSGVLQLLFARPVRRAEYVMSRWVAVWIGASVLMALQLAAAWMILNLRGAPLDGQDVALALAKGVIEAGQLAAVMAMLSALVNGAGDLGVWFLAQIVGGIMALAAQMKGWPWMGRLADNLGEIVTPNVNLAGLASGGSVLPLVTALSITAVALVIAVVLVNRKELSYASAGA